MLTSGDDIDHFLFRLPTASAEEIQAQNLIQHSEIDQAIAIYQNLKPYSALILHLLGVIYAEKKSDHHSAISYFQQALQIKEEVID